MSYKIYKQTDEQIVLQDTGGVIDFVFGAVLAAIGAGIIYLGWFGYQDTGEIFMPLIVTLVGSCLFFPVFKRNRLTIDAVRKEVVKTKSWFGITAEKEIVTNNNLSLLEMSGFTSGKFAAFFDNKEAILHHYALKFYCHPEWHLTIRNLSTMINVVMFFEKHFDTDLALVIQDRRHKFSTKGLLRDHKPTALPNDDLVRESSFQQLTLGGMPASSLKFWLFAANTIGIAFFIVIFVLFFSESIFTPYVSMPIQYALSVLLIGFFSWIFFYRSSGVKLKIYNDKLIVKHGVFTRKTYKLSDVIGVVNMTRNTYLVTRLGAECLAFKLPTKHSYAIHSWLAPYLKP
ncbi:hypothetical protein K0I63_03260 [Shewanella rhizosphaerae]|uniref:hypothetical protein n=1 Tax=Shewanella rhizosphaerae TaxID=2864207 RepID=UPI001C65F85B|nr:hypothetical protein [Shewanella rhizosphaerae]QYK13548.1 hypothetical protein K0I63_03260 [Shewanella rhizosphaerae]